MARIALIKLFTGLELGVSQLAGELKSAGHEALIVFFKDYIVAPYEDIDDYLVTDYAGIHVNARGRETVWNCYTPFTDLEYKVLRETLEKFRPDMIGFSLTSGTLKQAREVTAELKQYFQVPFIWGGSGPTLEPEECIQHADLLCINEGEAVIVDLADRIDRNEDLTTVPGVWAKADGKTIRNPGRPLIDLEKLAIPDFEPSRIIHIHNNDARGFYRKYVANQYPIMTTRGCPFACTYCIESVYKKMFDKKKHLRRRSVDVVIQELVQAKEKFDLKSVMFYDDVFTIFPSWLREFAPRYKKEVGLPFWCYTYPSTTSSEILLLLKDAGLKIVTMGVQSGSDDILKNYFDRPVDKQKVHEAAQTIVDCGISGFFDMITRLPSETEKHCRQTFNFLVDFPKEMKTVGFGHMAMFPEYEFTKKMKEGGYTFSLSDKDYAYYHKLYLLTRTSLPRPLIRAVGNIPFFRWLPSLIDPLLPRELPSLRIEVLTENKAAA